MEDVARAAGVSTITVSRVVNGSTSVKRSTSNRVNEAIRSLNYTPNTEARVLAGGRKTRIGFLYAHGATAHLGELLIGSLRQSVESGVQLVMLGCSDDEEEHFIRAILQENNLHGAVVAWPLCNHRVVTAVLEKADLPYVAAIPDVSCLGLSSLDWDDRRGAFIMTQHLQRLGHRRICFIGGDHDDLTSVQCLEGYRDALTAEAMIEDPQLVIMNCGDYRMGLDIAEEILDREVCPTAVFASTDEVAAAVIAIAHGRGLDVPADLTVCGFGDTPLGSKIWPQLTTMQRPVVEIARKTMRRFVQQLRRQVQSESPSGLEHSLIDHLSLEYRLIRRQSDAAPRSRPRRESGGRRVDDNS